MPGEPPPTLLDYFSRDFLIFIDESHQTVPQLHGMYHGDRSRKSTLVEYGFRMPSALDNRPLTFEEFEHRTNQLVYVSATPGPYELTKSAGVVVEQVIRPTGLVDPPVEVRPVKGQIDDLLHEIRDRVSRNERVLVTTLTKRMAEDLAEYYSEVGVKCRYMHSEIEVLERVKILRDLRKGEFDVLIGINLTGRDSRCRQRRVPSIERVFDSNRGPVRPKSERAGGAVCRPHDRFDEESHGRDRSPACDSGSLQRRERNHAGINRAAARHVPGAHC